MNEIQRKDENFQNICEIYNLLNVNKYIQSWSMLGDMALKCGINEY